MDHQLIELEKSNFSRKNTEVEKITFHSKTDEHSMYFLTVQRT
jgi:hypothetical protein